MFGETLESTGRDALALARTLRTMTTLTGIGLHSGKPVTLTVHPAAGSGIRFRRIDLLEGQAPEGQEERLAAVTVRAAPDAVTKTQLGTVIANEHGVTVSTVEHLMAAFAGLGIDHALVELDGPEVPIMDGSAAPFLAALERAGLRDLPTPRLALRITAPIRVELGDAWAEIAPLKEGEQGCPLDITVDYKDPAIGRQRLVTGGTALEFRQDVAAARTFCDLADVEAMRAQGLAQGGSMENAIVVSEGRVLNEDGLRMATEFVAHKALDLIGDLHLLGRPLLGRVTAFKPGHALNTRLAAAIAASPFVAETVMPEDAEAGLRVQA